MNPLPHEFLHRVISEGPQSVGLSSLMPLFRPQLSDWQIDEVIEYVRTFAEPAFEFGECTIESRQQHGEPPDRTALLGMRIPAVEGKCRDARSVVGRHQPRHAARRCPYIAGAGSRGLHCAVARSRPIQLEALRQRLRQRRITTPVQIEQPVGSVLRGLRDVDRRPADGGCSSAQDQRRGRTDRQRTGQRPVKAAWIRRSERQISHAVASTA